MDVAALDGGHPDRGIAGRCAIAGRDVPLRGRRDSVVMNAVADGGRARRASVDRVTGTVTLESVRIDASEETDR